MAAVALLALPGNSHSVDAASARLPALAPAAEPPEHVRTMAARRAALLAATAHPFGQTPVGHVLPVQRFRITSYFGNTDPVHTGGVHSGVDFAAPEGTPIVSICAGKVVEAGWLGAAGNAAVVRTEAGQRVLYGHMSALHVDKGDTVAPGEGIGLMGSTGNSTGPHLHLQVNSARGKLIDPVDFLGVGHREIATYGRD